MKFLRLLLLVALVSFSFGAFGQVGITQNFNSSSFPTGWTASPSSSPSSTSTCEGSHGVRYNLYSSKPTFQINTTSTATSNGEDITVSFDYKLINYTGGTATTGNWGTIEVEYSIDGGSTYTTFHTINSGNHTSSTSCANVSEIIPGASVPSSSSMRFRWKAIWATGDYYFQFDNVSITQPVFTPPNCTTLSSPSDAATSIAATTDLTWTAATGVPTGYKIDLGTTTGGTDILNDYDAGLVTTYNLPNDLTYNTTYYATVKPYNGNGSAVGCTETTFTTKDGCITPTTPSNGSSTASINQTISWSSYDAGVVKYIVSIGTTAGGTDILNAHDNGTATSYAASGLSYSTQYYVSIKAENANGLTTAACNTYNFTTMADPTLTPPFVEPFATYLPANWTETSGVLAAPSTLSGTTSNWGVDGFANSGGTGAAGINIYGTSRKDWLISPPVNLGAGATDYQLEFDVALTDYNSSNSITTDVNGTTGMDDIFAVVISTDNGVTWTSVNTLRQWDNAGSPYVYNSIATAGEHIVLDLSAYSGVVKFGFYGFSNTSNADNDLFVDNVEVSEILSADVEVTTVTVPASGCGLTANESVMVTITNNGMNPIAAGDASVVITGAANSPAAVVNVGSIASLATEVITITGVDLSTVQAYTLTATVTLAGDGNAGNNTGTGNVTNLTTISSFPYTEDFESGNGNWTSGGTNNSWALGTPTDTDINSAASGTNAWVTNLSGNYNDDENSYVSSPCFDFSGLTAPKVSLSVYTEAENSYDGALLQYSTDGGSTWTTIGDMNSGGTNWYNDGTISGLNWADGAQDGWTGTSTSAWATAEHEIFALAGESSVIFRIAFGADGSSNDDGFAFDDFHIENVSCPDPSTLTATGITTSTASLDWTENGTATAWDIEWGTEGFSATGTPTITGTTTKPYGLTGLTANTGYDFYVRSNCGGSTSDWVGPYSFTTACAAVATFYEDFESSTSSTLPDCMQKSGSTGTVVVNTTSSNAYAGSNSLRLFTSGATFVFPITSNIDAGTHRLRMQARATSSNTVKVGYITDPDDAGTFTELQTLSLTSSYQEYVVVPGVTPPSGAYLALQATSSSPSYYFDNVYWEELPVTPPNCSVVTSPADAATNQNVTTNLSWAANVDATGYKLSIGTTTGGTDILNASDLGNVLTYNPPADLAFNTTYYVTLTAYNANGDATGCTETTFTTRDGCAIPTSPTNGSTSVSTSPTISWSSVTGATGYMISIGTTAGGTDILNAHDNGSATSYAASGLSYVTQYYVSVKAYNANGTTSAACNTYEFTTSVPPPANDDCANAVVLALGSSSASGNTNGATQSQAACQGNANDDVWYTFTALATGTATITVTPSGTDPINDIVVQLFSGSCGTLTSVVCRDNTGTTNAEVISQAVTNGTVYYLRVYSYYSASTTDAGQFTIVVSDNVLPVELTKFTATQEGTTNVLNWETASEENNSHFEVERSTNGLEFETIGTIEGNGTTVEASKYNFVDETPAMVSYYRLRQVDFDGNFEYSNVVIVKRDRVTNNEVTLYPVPVNDRLTVQYTATANEEMTITVVDVTGRIVVTNAVTATQGENQFFIDFTELPAGSYFVRLQSDLTNIINTVIKN